MHRESAARWSPWCLVIALVLALSGLACSSSKTDDSELLLVYSGDCKAYLEPCG